MKTPCLAQVRIAVALAHAEPGCVVELAGPEGHLLRVGRSCRTGCTVSPCAIRHALVEAISNAEGEPEGPGRIAGAVRARVLDGPGGLRHLGLGAYRCGRETGRIAFGLLLPLSTVEACVKQTIDDLHAGSDGLGDALAGCAVRAEHDTGLGTTVVVVEGAGSDLDEELEHLALRLCAACRVEELLAEESGAPPPRWPS